MTALVIHVTDPTDPELTYRVRFGNLPPVMHHDRLAAYVKMTAETGLHYGYGVDPTTAIWTAELVE